MIWILTAMAGAVAGPPPPSDGEARMLLSGCNTAAYDSPLSPDVPAWTKAVESNRLDDFRAFVARYPRSRCAAAARQWVAQRERAAAGFAAEPADGATGAILIGDPAFAISSDDYPMDALVNGEEGRVAIAFDIAPDGMIESCQIAESSGSLRLDQVSCELAMLRARFRPARDATGRPMRSSGMRRILWQIPPERQAEVRRSLIPGWRMSIAPLKRR